MFDEFKMKGVPIEPFASELEELLSDAHDEDIESQIEQFMLRLLLESEQRDEAFRLSAEQLLLSATRAEILSTLESWYGRQSISRISKMVANTFCSIDDIIDTDLMEEEGINNSDIDISSIGEKAMRMDEITKRTAKLLSKNEILTNMLSTIPPENPRVLIGSVMLAMRHLARRTDVAEDDIRLFTQDHSSDSDVVFVICELSKLGVVSTAQAQMACDYVG